MKGDAEAARRWTYRVLYAFLPVVTYGRMTDIRFAGAEHRNADGI